MTFSATNRFKRAYKTLPPDIQNSVKKCLSLLEKDLRYPGLHCKKIKGTENIWEARVTLDYRLTFEFQSDTILLRNVGHHDPTLRSP